MLRKVARFKFFWTFLLSFIVTLMVSRNFKVVVDVWVYFIFSLSFISLLASSIEKRFSELLFLTNSLFFLGFWGKVTSHLLTGHRWGESSGGADIGLLNESLLLSAFAGLVIHFFQFSLKKVKFNSMNERFESREANPSFRFVLLIVLLVFVVAGLNWKLGFLRVGLKAEASIIFPFSLFLSWFMGPGCSFLIFLILPRGYRWSATLATSLSMVFISLSTVSRNSLMYFAYPTSIKFLQNFHDYKKSLLHSVIIFIFFIFSIFQVSNLRRHLYYNHELDSIKDISNTGVQVKEVFMDRWIGIEGVLVARKNTSDHNVKEMLFEDQKINAFSIYNRLAMSEYGERGKLLFSTFPGPIGLINMAQSTSLRVLLWLAFLALFGISFFCLEIFFSGYAKSAVSWWAATVLTQISIYPIYNLKIYFSYFVMMIFCVFIFNYFQKKYSDKANLK